MKRIRTGGAILASWLIYALSHLFPRNKRIWIFVGWHKNKEREIFADNSKYLFLHVANTRKDVRAVWIGSDDKIVAILRDNGYESYSVHSFLGTLYSLRAGYTIIDALMSTRNWRYSGRSRVIQLWHADGIKTLHLDSSWSWKKWKEIILTPGLFRKFHFFVASSKYIAKHFICPSFGVGDDKVRITGLPRYDVFFREISGAEIDMHTELEQTLKEIQSLNPKKLIFFTPTFRRGKDPNVSIAELKLHEVERFLVKNNYRMVISLHPKFSASSWMPKNEFSRIYFSNPDFDKFSLLHHFDTIVTDYSSMCLEFLLLDKPSIFYIYDFEEYKRENGIPEEFWSLVPGPRVTTFEALLDALAALDDREEERQRVRDILFTFEKGQSAELITQSILKEISAEQKAS